MGRTNEFVAPLPAILFAAMVALTGTSVARAAPNACGFVSIADVSAAIGGTVTGGKISQVDPTSGTASCEYASGVLRVTVSVQQYPSAAEAQAEVAKQLKDSRAHDGPGQKTTVETGIGDAAFSSTLNEGIELAAAMASHASVTVLISIMGKGASAIPHDRIHTLLAKATPK